MNRYFFFTLVSWLSQRKSCHLYRFTSYFPVLSKQAKVAYLLCQFRKLDLHIKLSYKWYN